MKKAVITLAVIAILSIAVLSYAHMWGGGYSVGYMMSPGYMMKGIYSPTNQKFLDETADLRKNLHTKRFELEEALRKGEYERAEGIEKEIIELEDKLYEKGGKRYSRFGGGRWSCPRPCGW